MTESVPDTGQAQPDTGGSAPEPATDQQPAATGDGTDWQAEAEKWKGLARKHETTAKKNKQSLDEILAKQQGAPSVDDLQKRLTDADTARQQAEERLVELTYANVVNRTAREVGADADALLDSAGFRDAVADELGEDFDDDDLAKAVAKVAKEFAAKPRFAAAGRVPARSGADITGGPGVLRQLTEADLRRMSPEEIVAAQEKGQLNTLLGIT